MIPDRDLVEALLVRKDESAFRELYRRLTPRLYMVLLRLLGNNEMDAEDALQETWLRVVRELGGFRWESGLATWLTAIGLNVARDVMRKRQRRPEVVDSRLLEWQPAPAQSGDGIDLERAIAALPDGYRTVLVLHDVEGFTHEEIARWLGISAGTSKSQLFGARRAMRKSLRPAEEVSDDARRA